MSTRLRPLTSRLVSLAPLFSLSNPFTATSVAVKNIFSSVPSFSSSSSSSSSSGTTAYRTFSSSSKNNNPPKLPPTDILTVLRQQYANHRSKNKGTESTVSPPQGQPAEPDQDRKKTKRSGPRSTYLFTLKRTEMHFIEREDIKNILEDYQLTDEEIDEIFQYLPEILGLPMEEEDSSYPEYVYSDQRYGGDDPYEIYEGLRDDVTRYFKDHNVSLPQRKESAKDGEEDSD